MTTFRIVEADCIEAMAEMEENSVDAIVTDPPYGLEFMGKEWDRLGAYVRSDRTPDTTGRGSWFGDNHDSPRYGANPITAQAFHQAWATAALRILKPGGHLLSFGGTRTYHRLTCALEDAGFEIRDCLAWLYGSGFPKSLDVSKAIDKARDDRADVLRVTAEIARLRDAAGLVNGDLDAMFDFAGMAGHWTSIRSQPAVPTVDQWTRLREVLGSSDEMDAEVWRLNGRKGKPGENWDRREVVGFGAGVRRPGFAGDTYGPGGGERVAIDITTPATPDAQRWQGWGTALKPAFEPIVLARKPLSERSVAANVQRWGTGALNIDGCRVDALTPEEVARSGRSTNGAVYGDYTEPVDWKRDGNPHPGRWPANVILDEEAAGMLDEQTGERGGRWGNGVSKVAAGGYNEGWRGLEQNPDYHGDSGGASRFFYVPKADREERNRGLGGERSSHPTVKPVELMQWLVRMVTPPGGTVLDPFMGSGTTGMAAMREGLDFIGIEREAEYVEIARARILGDGPLFNVEAVMP